MILLEELANGRVRDNKKWNETESLVTLVWRPRREQDRVLLNFSISNFLGRDQVQDFWIYKQKEDSETKTYQSSKLEPLVSLYMIQSY